VIDEMSIDLLDGQNNRPVSSALIFAVIIGIIFSYQLISGTIPGRGFQIYRREQPVLYWTIFAVEVALVAGAVHLILQGS
jgi:hypothetical protein